MFQTDADLLIMGVLPLMSELPSWKGRYDAAYLEALCSWPATAPLVARREISSVVRWVA